MNFDEAFAQLLGNEGGFVDNSQDPGGATCWGITQRVALKEGYTGDMRFLPQETAKAIYRKLYWEPIRGDSMPDALKFALFDAAVNSGVKQAIVRLQLAEARGGWRLLMALGGAGAALGSAVSWAVQHVRWGQ